MSDNFYLETCFMKKLLFTILFILLLPVFAFSKDFDTSVIGMGSTKIRLIYGEPIEKVEYGVKRTYSFLYPSCIVFFKDDITYKIVERKDEWRRGRLISAPVANDQEPSNNNKKKTYNGNIVNDMFGSGKKEKQKN